MGRRNFARVLIVLTLALVHCGCASHRPVTCRKPAKVIGTESGGGFQGGWVLVRQDLSSDDEATRIAKAYHVRAQSLAYLHGFSVFPMPEGPKFLCDKAVVEVHYDPVQGVAAR